MSSKIFLPFKTTKFLVEKTVVKTLFSLLPKIQKNGKITFKGLFKLLFFILFEFPVTTQWEQLGQLTDAKKATMSIPLFRNTDNGIPSFSLHLRRLFSIYDFTPLITIRYVFFFIPQIGSENADLKSLLKYAENVTLPGEVFSFFCHGRSWAKWTILQLRAQLPGL